MNHYDVLGLTLHASRDEIRAAYLRLAQELHPDRNVGASGSAREQFQRIQAAYEVLYDPKAREAYDVGHGMVPQPRAQPSGTVVTTPVYPGTARRNHVRRDVPDGWISRSAGASRRLPIVRLATFAAIVGLLVVTIPRCESLLPVGQRGAIQKRALALSHRPNHRGSGAKQSSENEPQATPPAASFQGPETSKFLPQQVDPPPTDLPTKSPSNATKQLADEAPQSSAPISNANRPPLQGSFELLSTATNGAGIPGTFEARSGSPETDLPSVSPSAIDLPTVELPAIQLPTHEWLGFESHAMKSPHATLPATDRPAIKMPDTNQPRARLPDFSLPHQGSVGHLPPGHAFPENQLDFHTGSRTPWQPPQPPPGNSFTVEGSVSRPKPSRLSTNFFQDSNPRTFSARFTRPSSTPFDGPDALPLPVPTRPGYDSPTTGRALPFPPVTAPVSTNLDRYDSPPSGLSQTQVFGTALPSAGNLPPSGIALEPNRNGVYGPSSATNMDVGSFGRPTSVLNSGNAYIDSVGVPTTGGSVGLPSPAASSSGSSLVPQRPVGRPQSPVRPIIPSRPTLGPSVSKPY